uniref:Uncharacterized protein n=1 Tax=Arundo donax TaxID=35708 RepID=A0A0A9CC36_ARUDO
MGGTGGRVAGACRAAGTRDDARGVGRRASSCCRQLPSGRHTRAMGGGGG